MANDFIVDVGTGRLITDFLSTKAAGRPTFIFGDQPTVTVRLVESNNNDADLPWNQLDLTGKTIRLAIGTPGGDPTGGTYNLTYGANVTTSLDWDSTAAEVDTALNALASVTSAGGVTVAAFGTASSGYRVTFDAVGARTLITADTSALTPSTAAFISQVQTGDGSTKEAQIVSFETDANAYVELTTDLPLNPSIVVTTVTEGVTSVTSEVQRIVTTGPAYAGTFQLTIDSEITAAIAYDASTDEITTAIQALASIGANGVLSISGDSTDFTVTFNRSLGNIGESVPDATNLSGPVGKTGELDLNVTGILELLDGAQTKTAVLEIVEFTISGSKESTVLQVNSNVNQDVLPGTPPSTTPLPSYPDRSEVFPVPYDVTGTTYTLSLDDVGRLLRTTNAAAVSITVPPFASEAFTLGDAIVIKQHGAGQITIVEGAGVTVEKPTTQTRTSRSQKSVIMVFNDASDVWTLSGDTDFA